MYVADESDGRVYTYNMPDDIDARLASLSLSDVEIGEFSGSQPEYEGVASEDATATTVEAVAVQSGATVVIEPDDSDEDANGHQAAVADGSEITVTVTSPDAIRTRVYRVRIGEVVAEETEDPQAEPAPAPVSPSVDCLRGLTSGRFSLVTYEGGSVVDLDACARSKSVVAVYVWSDGAYVSYIIGAPEFVNRAFRDHFPDGLDPVTPLIAKHEPPVAEADVDTAGQ